MALNPTSLASDLDDIFSSYPDSAEEAAHRFALAYASYCEDGMFNASTMPSCAVIATAVEGALLSALPQQTSIAFAQAIANALTTSWVGIPVVGPQTGATIGCPGAVGLVASLSAILNSQPATTLAAAQQIAGALHSATISVTALISIPSPPTPVVATIS